MSWDAAAAAAALPAPRRAGRPGRGPPGRAPATSGGGGTGRGEQRLAAAGAAPLRSAGAPHDSCSSRLPSPLAFQPDTGAASLIFSPFKDITINFNWGTNVIGLDIDGEALV